ncbi:ATP-dependent DNA helicase PIF1 [Cryptococcus neoformans MW-RSA36]|nr:ATP-dependent DNA helicase PIF1 [Cryptococcus neoformans var. grubii MW-RSA36]
MPILTARTLSASNSSNKSNGTLSRVTSFKRNWGEEDGPESSQLDWSPSPEVVQRKGNILPPSGPLKSTTTLPNLPESAAKETASQRRRKAILAALNQNKETTSASPVPGFCPGQASSTVTSPQDIHYDISVPPVATHCAGSSIRLVSQTLPSLPKRPLPWEGDQKVRKKVYTQTSLTSKENAQPKSTSSALNIKQRVTLSEEQQKVLTLVIQQQKNVFFTGSAGTGKSVLLREIIHGLRNKYAKNPDAVAVTASTGIAACNIGGVTLHSFGGVGLATDTPEILLRKLKLNKKASGRWTKTKVLIIDEVSMVDGAMFDKFCKLGQLIRKNSKPWGGIQIIVTGDFFQLPPVTKNGGMPKFAFEAEMWDETIHLSVNLTKVFRQKDQRFVDMLNEMRFGRLSNESIVAFKSLARPLKFNDGIEPTALFPRREDVDRANLSRLNQLDSVGFTYHSIDGGSAEANQREKLLSNFMAPKVIELKEHAQVMLVKNLDETLVNGSMGKVIGFTYKNMFQCDDMGKWTPDADLKELEEEDKMKSLAVRQALRDKYQAKGANPLPVVRFKVPGGGTRDVLMEMDVFKAELPNGEVQASRSQLPLILAWAMSIHKSQGQTLDRGRVDLGKVFEKGQAYVALSRATSLEGLQVTGFTAEKVMAHKKVAVWSSTLKDLNLV